MTNPSQEIISLLNHDYGQNIDIDCRRDNADICKTTAAKFGFNSLELAYPEIAKEWDCEKNPLTPNRIPAHRGTKIWWICEQGHSYSAVIFSRTGKDHMGCPICSGKGKRVNERGKYPGMRYLLEICPEIAKEFHWKHAENRKTVNYKGEFYGK